MYFNNVVIIHCRQISHCNKMITFYLTSINPIKNINVATSIHETHQKSNNISSVIEYTLLTSFIVASSNFLGVVVFTTLVAFKAADLFIFTLFKSLFNTFDMKGDQYTYEY